jgi:hypothetical protein
MDEKPRQRHPARARTAEPREAGPGRGFHRTPPVGNPNPFEEVRRASRFVRRAGRSTRQRPTSELPGASQPGGERPSSFPAHAQPGRFISGQPFQPPLLSFLGSVPGSGFFSVPLAASLSPVLLSPSPSLSGPPFPAPLRPHSGHIFVTGKKASPLLSPPLKGRNEVRRACVSSALQPFPRLPRLGQSPAGKLKPRREKLKAPRHLRWSPECSKSEKGGPTVRVTFFAKILRFEDEI